MASSRIFNLGSINMDHVYQVPHFVRPGETLASAGYARSSGGKGFNQSMALARAGARVHHIGAIGEDGYPLRAELASAGVDVSSIRLVDAPTGHAVIQVAPEGENSILLHSGANHAIDPADVRSALTDARPGDWFLAQNETSAVPDSLIAARAAGLRVALNPAPMTPAVANWPLDLLHLLVLNETEGLALAGVADASGILDTLCSRHPRLVVVLTLGAQGARFAGPDGCGSVKARKVRAVDTTAAGDTFLGFLLARLALGFPLKEALDLAIRASALAVTRRGAAASIPSLAEVRAFSP